MVLRGSVGRSRWDAAIAKGIGSGMDTAKAAVEARVGNEAIKGKREKQDVGKKVREIGTQLFCGGQTTTAMTCGVGGNGQADSCAGGLAMWGKGRGLKSVRKIGEGRKGQGRGPVAWDEGRWRGIELGMAGGRW